MPGPGSRCTVGSCRIGVYGMIIAVASGKGGTGKTTVATNLALILAEKQHLQFMDLDVEAPNAHIFLQPEFSERKHAVIPVPEVDPDKCDLCGECAEICAFNALMVGQDRVLVFEELCHGCGGCTMLCPQGAISEWDRPVGDIAWGEFSGSRFVHGELTPGEALAPPVTRQIKELSEDYPLTIIDAPPGTSCPAVEAVKDANYCVLVTEPTPFGLRDLELAVEMTQKISLKIGVVINRSDVGDEEVERYCARENIPVLASLPFDREVAEAYAEGEPAVTVASWRARFEDLADEILSRLENGEGA